MVVVFGLAYASAQSPDGRMKSLAGDVTEITFALGQKEQLVAVALLGALLALSVVVALGWGAVSVGPGQIVAILLARAGLAGNGTEAPTAFVAAFSTQQ